MKRDILEVETPDIGIYLCHSSICTDDNLY